MTEAARLRHPVRVAALLASPRAPLQPCGCSRLIPHRLPRPSCRSHGHTGQVGRHGAGAGRRPDGPVPGALHLQPILASGLIAWGVMVPVQCGRGTRCQQHYSCLPSRRSMYFALLIFVQAVRHGIARALQNWEPKLRPLLKTEGAFFLPCHPCRCLLFSRAADAAGIDILSAQSCTVRRLACQSRWAASAPHDQERACITTASHVPVSLCHPGALCCAATKLLGLLSTPVPSPISLLYSFRPADARLAHCGAQEAGP